MLIAKAYYRNDDWQTACICLWQRTNDYYITTTIGGDSLTQPPEWSQIAKTEADARQIGNHFHRELKATRHMHRLPS
jgi:hypothetical protein